MSNLDKIYVHENIAEQYEQYHRDWPEYISKESLLKWAKRKTEEYTAPFYDPILTGKVCAFNELINMLKRS